MTGFSVLSVWATKWAVKAFGADHVYNKRVRAIRIMEEAVELCQAVGVPRDMALCQVMTVYDRPIGQEAQELAGIQVTLAVFAEAHGHNLEVLFENEMWRVTEKGFEHFAKRNQEKIALGLTGG